MTERSRREGGRQRQGLRAACACAVLVGLLTTAAAKDPAQPRVTIGYVEIAGDPRYEPVTGYGRVVLKSRERPFVGAQLGIDDAQAVSRALKIDFALERISVSSAAEVAPAVAGARDARGIRFFIADAPAEAFRPLVDTIRGRDILVFNATAADDALRRNLCAAEVVHTLPSLAMSMDGLVQYLVSRKWTNLLVLEGPLPADAVMVGAFESSARKFGARLVARQQFTPGTDPRERERNDPALLSAINRDYDVVFVADHAFDFARRVPYGTLRARPVVGSIDLEPMAWHWTYERHGAPQVNSRFLRLLRGPPHGKRGLGGVDCGQDGGAGDPAHALGGVRRSAQVHARRCRVRRQQGARRERSSLGPPVASGDPARLALFRGRAGAGRGLSPPDQRARHARRRRAGIALPDEQVAAMRIAHAAQALRAVTTREIVKFVQQRGRLLSALVRPLMWLAVFAAGFYNVFGVSIIPPYKTYITYQVYIVPGLLGIILLFHGMQSSLSMVYDREMGMMRLLLTAPLPRWVLLACKLAAGTALSVLTCYVFLAVCILFDVTFDWSGWLYALPALVVSGLMLGALWLFLSVYIRQVENFAGAMNFVMFPMFFFSSALYPLWKLREGGSEIIYLVSLVNPFTHAVELIRWALYGMFEPTAAAVVSGAAVVFFLLAVMGYDPQRGMFRRSAQPV